VTIHIGTSGWHYPHWSGRFYPAGMHSDEWLAYYATQFGCVEINSSFYRLPAPSTLDRWRGQAPEGFTFTLKASRYITHMKKLHDCAEPLDTMLRLARRLGDHLGAILFQLPPRWRINPSRLADFLDLLPDDLPFAIEFRDPSWHAEPVYGLLRRHAVAFCQFDLAGLQSPPVLTADLVYLRLHGPHRAYAGSYAEKELRGWADRLKAWDSEGHDAYVFFDNDQDASAVKDARALQHWVSR
jgi:uncharacterized protein YecE (DUF72 family)